MMRWRGGERGAVMVNVLLWLCALALVAGIATVAWFRYVESRNIDRVARNLMVLRNATLEYYASHRDWPWSVDVLRADGLVGDSVTQDALWGGTYSVDPQADSTYATVTWYHPGYVTGVFTTPPSADAVSRIAAQLPGTTPFLGNRRAQVKAYPPGDEAALLALNSRLGDLADSVGSGGGKVTPAWFAASAAVYAVGAGYQQESRQYVGDLAYYAMQDSLVLAGHTTIKASGVNCPNAVSATCPYGPAADLLYGSFQGAYDAAWRGRIKYYFNQQGWCWQGCDPAIIVPGWGAGFGGHQPEWPLYSNDEFYGYRITLATPHTLHVKSHLMSERTWALAAGTYDVMFDLYDGTSETWFIPFDSNARILGVWTKGAGEGLYDWFPIP